MPQIFFLLFGTFGYIGSRQTNSMQSKKDFISLETKFSTSNNIVILHNRQIFIIIYNFDQKLHFRAKFDLKHRFYNLGPCEKCVNCINTALQDFFNFAKIIL